MSGFVRLGVDGVLLCCRFSRDLRMENIAVAHGGAQGSVESKHHLSIFVFLLPPVKPPEFCLMRLEDRGLYSLCAADEKRRCFARARVSVCVHACICVRLCIPMHTQVYLGMHTHM